MGALIIDDEADICYLLSNILKQKNLNTNYVNSLSEAAVILQKENPPIIFLDNHLPDGLGINFVEHIKQKHPDAKVIMITAHDTSLDKETAMQKGVDMFIGKPFNKEIINKAVDNLL